MLNFRAESVPRGDGFSLLSFLSSLGKIKKKENEMMIPIRDFSYIEIFLLWNPGELNSWFFLGNWVGGGWAFVFHRMTFVSAKAAKISGKHSGRIYMAEDGGRF